MQEHHLTKPNMTCLVNGFLKYCWIGKQCMMCARPNHDQYTIGKRYNHLIQQVFHNVVGEH